MTGQALTAADFPAFFAALWGQDPFPWQARLAERILAPGADPWPDAITLPTAAGKTACMDIALFALAVQAYRGDAPLTAPRRIFFVVDRRIIVDEAYDRANRLARALVTASDGILHRVARVLRQLAGGADQPPVFCSQLRGGIYRDDAWARSPIQPTIVCSTVDQVGSRLLFRAYGRSFKSWHLHAGLVGNDSLILLDEAHCAEPFRQTLHAVARYRTWAEVAPPTPFRVVLMTATPANGADSFPDPATAAADRAHPVLKARREAPKPCRLVVAERAQGRDAVKVNGAMARELVAAARQLIADWAAGGGAGQGAPAVAIFCNRVGTARRALALLDAEPGVEALLLTGRMRPLDYQDSLAVPLATLAADKPRAPRDRPLCVVSTQTLEVGANLDFDLMVSECADLSALRQRFGRLNRMGRAIPARGVICVRADQQTADVPDPIYGKALGATWTWLLAQSQTADGIDFGIDASTRWSIADPGALTATPPDAPVLLPAHLDALAQTAPAPEPEPEVALFLHGPNAGPADVQVCWRADLLMEPTDTWERDWIEAVAACPPAAGELMPVPFLACRRWFNGVSDAADSGDVEGIAAGDEGKLEPAMRVALRWCGPEEAALIDSADALRPGDLLVIPAGLGGWDLFGHFPPGAVRDLGDRANRVARATGVLRLTPAVLDDWPSQLPTAALRDLLAGSAGLLETDPRTLVEGLHGVLRPLAAAAADLPGWTWLAEVAAALLAEVATALVADRHPTRVLSAYQTDGLCLRASRRLPPTEDSRADFTHEDDATASGSTGRPIPLETHLEGVRDYARRFSTGLPAHLAGDVQLAAGLHDLGKADPRFQALLRGGNRWLTGGLLAKSGLLPSAPGAYRRACRAAGLPPGARHELVSVRLIESSPALLAAAHDPDLILHLVASHHGWCRPFAPVVVDSDPLPVTRNHAGETLRASTATGLERLDSGVAERFWRLVRRYGWWGLSGLEATMMLADHRCSEAEAR